MPLFDLTRLRGGTDPIRRVFVPFFADPSRGAVVSLSQAALLRKYGLRPDKRLGQHFLVDARVRRRIVDAVSDLHPEHVVELGAGAGALTAALLDRQLRVTALELDSRLIEVLRQELGARGLEVVASDLAREDFTRWTHAPVVFVGNLPYQVTSLVVLGLLPAFRTGRTLGAVLMMQAEVAQRLAARPGGRTYGVLTVLLSAEVTVRRLFAVKPGCFLPPPAVDSTVVMLTPRPDRVDLDAATVALVRKLFQQRRKQLGGLLRRHHDLTASDLEAMSQDLSLDPRCRPESLSLSDFVGLSRWLQDREAA